jgi:hypothetical protein
MRSRACQRTGGLRRWSMIEATRTQSGNRMKGKKKEPQAGGLLPHTRRLSANWAASRTAERRCDPDQCGQHKDPATSNRQHQPIESIIKRRSVDVWFWRAPSRTLRRVEHDRHGRRRLVAAGSFRRQRHGSLHTGHERECHDPNGVLMFRPHGAGRPPRCPKCQDETRPHCRSPGCRWWRCDHCGVQGGRLIKGTCRWVYDKPQKTP